MIMSASLSLGRLNTLGRLDDSVMGIIRDASKLKQKHAPYWILETQIFWGVWKGRLAFRLLGRMLGNYDIQSDQRLKKMEEIAVDLDRMASRLSEALELYETIPRNNFLVRHTKRKMEEFLCHIEDLQETATLVSKKEFHEVTAKIIDSHLMSNK